MQANLKEPEKWVKAREAGKITGVKFGSYASLLGDARWRGRAIIGMLLCISGVIGLWGIGFFSPELINDVVGRALKAEGISPAKQAGYRTIWMGLNMIIQNAGSFVGMILFTKLASRYGRKPIFAAGYICAMI